MTAEPNLFSPLTIRGITLRNRIAVSPMCEYSSDDGFANDWHLVHLGCRAVGGAGLVMTEASAVTTQGRITPGDLGIYKDEHIANLARIAAFINSMAPCRGCNSRMPVAKGAAGFRGKEARPCRPRKARGGPWRPARCRSTRPTRFPPN